MTERVASADAENSDSLANDLLRGVAAIAAEIGEKPRKVYHLLENKLIPAGKEGAIWAASRRALRAHYRRLTQGEAA